MNLRNLILTLVLLVLLGGLYLFKDNLGLAVAKPTPTPSADTGDLDAIVTASGTVLPPQRANLSFRVAGQANQVTVKQGDKVKKGDLLVRLEAAELEAAVAIARANLAQLKAGATREEIAVAQANLETALAQLSKVRAGAMPEEVTAAMATLQRAQANLNDAQAAFDKVKDDPAVGMFPQSQALHLATQEFRIAQARYAQVVKGATPEDIRIAETAVSAAQAALDRVKAGTRPEEIAAAQARLDQAKAAVTATVLYAPFDGTIASISLREGETVSPGIPIITLGDTSHLRLETDDLSETSIARVKLGQISSITYESLPGKVFKGQVSAMAPIATAKQGGTNYTVTIELDDIDPVLRWGMTGHIEINTRQ